MPRAERAASSPSFRPDRRRRSRIRAALAGLYQKVPRLEHCGAVFVWTKFHLGGEE